MFAKPQVQGYVKVEGGEVWYRGNGTEHAATPLLIVHGGPGMNHEYLLTLLDLANERPVYFYDQLDAGASDRPGDTHNWRVDRFVSELDEIRCALAPGRVIVFGNSWGGTLVSAYAASQPSGLVGVILSSPLIETRRWIEDNARYRLALPADVRATLDHHESRGSTDTQAYADAVDAFNKRHFCRSLPWPDHVQRSMERINGDCYEFMWGPNEFTCNGTLSSYDGSAGLGRIEAPVLFTCGRYDEATPQACESFAARVENAEVAIFEDASHLAFVEQQEAYMERLRSFLRHADRCSSGC